LPVAINAETLIAGIPMKHLSSLPPISNNNFNLTTARRCRLNHSSVDALRHKPTAYTDNAPSFWHRLQEERMNDTYGIKTALISIDMALTNARCAMAILKQNKTFVSDAAYALETLEGAKSFLCDAISDVKEFVECAKNTEQANQPDSGE
jgi:hypothetical protein